MSSLSIIQTLEKLLLLYKSLHSLAVNKTEIIKKGTVQPLNTVISEEKQHLQAIQKLEKKLTREAKTFLKEKGITTDRITLSMCMEYASQDEKIMLEKLKIELEDQINQLKQQNGLNQQLLEQSLKFVNLSLDMLLPEIDTFNYDRPNHEQDTTLSKRSIFDSKA